MSDTRLPLRIAARTEIEYLRERLLLGEAWIHATGVSSNAMVLAAIWHGEVDRGDYPSDRWDWRRCLLAYVLAPEDLRERMRPIMRSYCAELRPTYRRWLAGSPTLAEALDVLGRAR